MRYLLRVLLVATPTLCCGQTTDLNSRLLDEVKGLRVAIDRLTSAMEAMEKRQDAAIVALQLTLSETQLRMLQWDRRELSAQEKDATARVSTLEASVNRQEAGTADGLKLPGNAQRHEQERLDAAKQSRNEIRARLQAIDLETSALRNRLEQLKKASESSSR